MLRMQDVLPRIRVCGQRQDVLAEAHSEIPSKKLVGRGFHRRYTGTVF
jgi:hypothetical protein